jgi:hypothetical protein
MRSWLEFKLSKPAIRSGSDQSNQEPHFRIVLGDASSCGYAPDVVAARFLCSTDFSIFVGASTAHHICLFWASSANTNPHADAS